MGTSTAHSLRGEEPRSTFGLSLPPLVMRRSIWGDGTSDSPRLSQTRSRPMTSGQLAWANRGQTGDPSDPSHTHQPAASPCSAIYCGGQGQRAHRRRWPSQSGTEHRALRHSDAWGERLPRGSSPLAPARWRCDSLRNPGAGNTRRRSLLTRPLISHQLRRITSMTTKTLPRSARRLPPRTSEGRLTEAAEPPTVAVIPIFPRSHNTWRAGGGGIVRLVPLAGRCASTKSKTPLALDRTRNAHSVSLFTVPVTYEFVLHASRLACSGTNF